MHPVYEFEINLMTESHTMILDNAVLVLPDRIVKQGWIAIVDGLIVEIGEGRAPESGIDIGGDYLVPGLIELHTDHVERHFIPRPKVRWHAPSAVLAYDAQIAAAGITTAFDSLRVGSDLDMETMNSEDLWELSGAMAALQDAGHLRAEHRTHLRCEIAAADVLDHAKGFISRYPVHLISLMDHTPGQRQFRDIGIWKLYYMGKRDASEEIANRMIAQRLDLYERYAKKHRRELVRLAREHEIVLASHDDATPEHVAEAITDGVAIAEFPTTMVAAAASHAAGIQVMMGAPNVVRGGSHSGNIAAEDLARDGLLDLLSSDYIPASLLMAAFNLPERVPGITLPQALAMVTLNPAKAARLNDRGALAIGLRADIVRVHLADRVPVVREVWRVGRRVV